MKIAVIAINKKGERLAGKIKNGFPGVTVLQSKMPHNGNLKVLVKDIFAQYDGIIFISAVGITIRVISPFIKSKFSDPAIVSLDSAGRFAVSVLSGHEGGANMLTYKIASITGALPVITTGEEVNKRIVLGIGMRRGISSSSVKNAISKSLQKKKLRLSDIRVVSSVDLKRNETGLINACVDLGLPLVFIPKESIRRFKVDSVSEVARRNIGLDGVCEPCALLASRNGRLILKKEIIGKVTVALCREN